MINLPDMPEEVKDAVAFVEYGFSLSGAPVTIKNVIWGSKENNKKHDVYRFIPGCTFNWRKAHTKSYWAYYQLQEVLWPAEFELRLRRRFPNMEIIRVPDDPTVFLCCRPVVSVNTKDDIYDAIERIEKAGRSLIENYRLGIRDLDTILSPRSLKNK
jgi:hypothetical protein